MKIEQILNEEYGKSRRIFDINSLPNELSVGDMFASKQSVMGEDMYGEKFKVVDKFFDPEMKTNKYLAFSQSARQNAFGDDEGQQVDFKFVIKDGRIIPLKGYEQVVRDFF